MNHSLIFKRTLSRHSTYQISFTTKAIDDLIYNERKHIVALFKDYLILNESSEFLSHYYPLFDSLAILGKILFCERNAAIKPVYTPLKSILPIMLRNKYKKDKVLKILLDDQPRESRPQAKNEKMINSSLVDESLAMSQVSARALFLQDKDRISKGCADFIERNEIDQLFTSHVNGNSDKQGKHESKYKKTPMLSKKKRNTGNSNSTTSTHANFNSNKTIAYCKPLNQLVQSSTRRNKALASSQGSHFKSLRKSSLTLDTNTENDALVNHLISTANQTRDKSRPISLYFENQKLNKLSSSTGKATNNANAHINPAMVKKALRNTIDNKLKKSRTFSKNETLEALSILQKEKQLLQGRMKKKTSPSSHNQKTGVIGNYMIKPANKKHLKIDTLMHLSQNKQKQHSSMMKLHPVSTYSKRIVISSFNSLSTTSKGGYVNSKAITTKNSTKIIDNSHNNTKGQSLKVSLALKNRNSCQMLKDTSLSLSKEPMPLNKRNSNKLQLKLPSVEANQLKVTNGHKKKAEDMTNYISVGSDRRSKTTVCTHVKSSSSFFAKKSDIKVTTQVAKKNSGLTSLNHKISINKTQSNQKETKLLKAKKHSMIALRKSPMKQIKKQQSKHTQSSLK